MLIIQEINIIKHNINMLDIEDFKKKLDKKSRIMGIDPGGKRIGIAISDENKIVATPYTTIIKNNYPDFIKEIKKLLMNIKLRELLLGIQSIWMDLQVNHHSLLKTWLLAYQKMLLKISHYGMRGFQAKELLIYHVIYQ